MFAQSYQDLSCRLEKSANVEEYINREGPDQTVQLQSSSYEG